MPWSRIYRDLSLAYGWTPAQINQLTLLQVCVYLGVPLKGDRVRMSVDQFHALRQRRQAQFAAQASQRHAANHSNEPAAERSA